jgi:hypothetical protein
MAYKTFVNGFPLNASEINNNLMNQSVATFLDASARSTAISAPVQGQVTYLTSDSTYYSYDGADWVEMIPTPETPASSPNYVINGAFDIFQRGTAGSLSLSAAGYALDRWYSSRGGAGGVTVSQQQTGSPIGSNYHARVAFTTDASFSNLFYAIESGEVNTLQGKTVTLSVKLRRNATFTANLNVALQKNATPDTVAGGTWTAFETVSNTNASLPTGTTSADWLTCTITAAIPDDGTANGLRIVISETATSLNGAYYEVAEVQLEVGDTATSFKRNQPNLQGELAACQRYYFRFTSASAAYTTFASFGLVTNSSLAYVSIFHPTEMRVPPTSIDFGSLSLYDGSSFYSVSSLTFDSATSDNTSLNAISSGLTTKDAVRFQANNTTASFIGLSAEL